ncbi:MAG: hypothetical protein ACE5K7_04630 [Phycisphaerae bacterium]
MLAVTEAAGAHMAQMLSEAEAPADVAIRFILAGRGLTLRLDSPRPGDATFDHEGRTVLVLDEEVSKLLADNTLDVQDAGEGPRLTLV